MADENTGVKISLLPSASNLADADVLAGVQSATTKKFSLATLKAFFIAAITPAGIGAVPQTRTVNNKALSADITLDADDVGARADDWMPSAADVGAQPEINVSGILKGDGNGGVSAAVAETDYATPAMIPTVPSAYDSNPEMDGTASPGISGAWARGDHVHPRMPGYLELWTNSNTGSNFAAQDVPGTGGFRLYLVVCQITTSSQGYVSYWLDCETGEMQNITFVSSPASTIPYISFRQVTKQQSGLLNISNCDTRAITATSRSQDNSQLIPYKIFGIY